MKKIKRLFALCTLLIFALCNFTGCSGSSSGSGNPDKDGTEQGAEDQNPAPEGSDDEEDEDSGEEDDDYDDYEDEEEDEEVIPVNYTNLGTFTVDEAINAIKNQNKGYYSVKITGTVTSDDISNIKLALFENMERYIELDLSETTGLTKLDNYAFAADGPYLYDFDSEDGTPISSIILPQSVTELGAYCFWKCSHLRNIKAPGVKVIQSCAFGLCSILTQVQFADVMEVIEYLAFMYNEKIKELTLNAKNINPCAVAYCEKLRTVKLGSAVEEISEAFSQLLSVEEFIVSSDNTHYKSEDGILYSADGTHLIQYPPYRKEEVFILPASVITMDSLSLAYPRYLEKLTLSNIKKIPDSACFCSPALKEVSIPVAEEIGKSAFEYCEKLSKITLPTSLTTIKDCALSRNPELKSIFIPSSVVTMGKYIFYQAATYGEESNQVINCQAPSKPDGWDDLWCYQKFLDDHEPEIIPSTINWGVDP